jgi:hypothetical protein
MKNLKEFCLECGSKAVSRTVDEVIPKFRMEVVNYACGAELKSMYSSNGNTGRLCLSGCSLIDEQVSPV